MNALICIGCYLLLSGRLLALQFGTASPVFDLGPAVGGACLQLYEATVFTQQDWLLRYTEFSGSNSEETAMSVYRKNGKLWVNVSRVDPSIFDRFTSAYYADDIDVKRLAMSSRVVSRDVEIPAKHARRLIALWDHFMISSEKNEARLTDLAGATIYVWKKRKGNTLSAKAFAPMLDRDLRRLRELIIRIELIPEPDARETWDGVTEIVDSITRVRPRRVKTTKAKQRDMRIQKGKI